MNSRRFGGSVWAWMRIDRLITSRPQASSISVLPSRASSRIRNWPPPPASRYGPVRRSRTVRTCLQAQVADVLHAAAQHEVFLQPVAEAGIDQVVARRAFLA